MRNKKQIEKCLIGWREWVSIPGLKIKKIKVKVDTGARTSALHVDKLKIIKKGDQEIAHFVVHPTQRSSVPEIAVKYPVESYKVVRSSNGQTASRPVVQVEVIFGDVVKKIEITLTNRDEMGFRMLLGRTALSKHFTIDPGRSYLLNKIK